MVKTGGRVGKGMNKIEFTDKQIERLTDWYLEIKMNKQERAEDKAIKNKILKCLIIIKNKGRKQNARNT